jgi:hypothetical protein
LPPLDYPDATVEAQRSTGIRQGSEPAARPGREEVDEHMARHVEAGWKLAFYSTNATSTGTVHHFIWEGHHFIWEGPDI